MMWKQNIRNIFFITIIVLISLVFLVKIMINNNEYNYVDNRMSYKLEIPDINSFFDGSYQKNMENAIADQIPKYQYFKLGYNKLKKIVSVNFVKSFDNEVVKNYVNLGGINSFDGYLLYEPYTKEKFESISENDIYNTNLLKQKTNANVYLYFVETDAMYNYATKSATDYKSYLFDNLNIDGYGYFDVSDFEDYKKYFYKTDHHWNYLGSYEGYREIAKMMRFDNILKPVGKECYDDVKFNGSKMRDLANLSIYTDTLCVYQYDYPRYEIYDSGNKVAKYGMDYDEIKSNSTLTYGDIYGWDTKELIFVNKNATNNKKLLIYANSYSNAINKLLASNYSKTYVIDGRHYNDMTMVDYINEHHIDDVLILANSMLFVDNISW